MFDPFDLNKDGKLDLAEGFLKYQAIVGDDEEDDVDGTLSIIDDNLDAADEEDLEAELELNGLDRLDLELMDEYERREALEDAGLDPDDFDDLFL